MCPFRSSPCSGGECFTCDWWSISYRNLIRTNRKRGTGRICTEPVLSLHPWEKIIETLRGLQSKHCITCLCFITSYNAKQKNTGRRKTYATLDDHRERSEILGAIQCDRRESLVRGLLARQWGARRRLAPACRRGWLYTSKRWRPSFFLWRDIGSSCLEKKKMASFDYTLRKDGVLWLYASNRWRPNSSQKG